MFNGFALLIQRFPPLNVIYSSPLSIGIETLLILVVALVYDGNKAE